MRRRDYLIGSVAALTTIAGCGNPGPGVNETDESPTGFETDTVGETAAESPTDMETGTPTETDVGSPTGTEAGSPTETETGTDMPSVEMVTDDDAEEYYFDPVGLAVEPGTTVEWSNRSGEHSSTAYEDRIPSEAAAWDSELLSEEGETFSHTFDAEGTYDYFCIPHQALGMVGRIVVGEPGGPAEEDMPPDGEVPDSQRIVDEGSVSYDDFTSE